ncbi:ABC transporter substrate-binding protein [Luteimonas sp. Y-2-2-4F]|nr:ABC transporter substrate-binding protein [Luteimonas sp. Y-2-2-4F]MCD9033307.1 ABC transporter substrate-binding protein [Luteimonas sp. Y-2-2-4F]
MRDRFRAAGRRRAVRMLALGALLPLLARAPLAARERPSVIRIGAPSIAVDPDNYYGALGLARYHGWLRQAFERDGVRLQMVGYRGGAPLVGQALANGQIDFAWQGDMLSLIGRSGGIRSRLILPMTRMSNAYLAVAPRSPVRSVADLRGRRVTYAKGNQIQLQVIRILAEHGMAERDIRSVALDRSIAAAALASGDVDAIFGGADLLALRDRGLARIVYDTRGQPVETTSFNALLVNEDFAERYPWEVVGLVKALVRGLHWATQAGNREALFRLWSEGGATASRYYLREDFEGRPLQDYLSPLLDPLFVAHYRRTQDLMFELRLMRGRRVDLGEWIDRRYLAQALGELGLRDHWSPLDAQGRPLARNPTPQERR